METLIASDEKQRKGNRKTKSKKKPIKVVYISNPMKVKTCASKFRALVQELTGQDAAGLPNPSKYINDTHDVGGNQTVLDATEIVGEIDHHRVLEVPEQQQHAISDFSFGSFDDGDVLMPQILENFPGFLPSSVCCGSSQVNM